MTDSENGFHLAIDTDPANWQTTVLVFADWLDERDDVRAAGYRVLAEFNLVPDFITENERKSVTSPRFCFWADLGVRRSLLGWIWWEQWRYVVLRNQHPNETGILYKSSDVLPFGTALRSRAYHFAAVAYSNLTDEQRAAVRARAPYPLTPRNQLRTVTTRPPKPHSGTVMDTVEFSRANRARCESPEGFKHNLNDWSLSDWMTALVGEVGEAANIVKKLNRYRDGIAGNSEAEAELNAKLVRELADAYVYLDLFFQRIGADMGEAVRDVFNAKSKQIGYLVVI